MVPVSPDCHAVLLAHGSRRSRAAITPVQLRGSLPHRLGEAQATRHGRGAPEIHIDTFSFRVGTAGVEPATTELELQCSVQLSYVP